MDPASEYNDLSGLEVPDEIRDMFQYIDRYRPPSPELETLLKPFIPDYIPAVGDIDEFIKVPRPDGRPDLLGLKTLDEPAPVQSDPTVLSMQIRSRGGGPGAGAARSLSLFYADHPAHLVHKLEQAGAELPLGQAVQ